MPEIEIQFASDAEYERLRAIRDKYGVTWRGMLLFGAQRLEGRVLPHARGATWRFPSTDGGTAVDSTGGERTVPTNTPTTRPTREGQ
jgi:predicted HTH transcriptional regulator